MFLSEIAIKRPVLTTITVLAILVFGWISYGRIGIDLFPKVEFPMISITSVLPGADPETMETAVSDPIEQEVSTLSGIKAVTSTSSEGVSQVAVQFELDKEVDIAFDEVQAKLAAVRAQLPRDLEEPVVQKMDVDAAPIMALGVSAQMPLGKLTDLADKQIKQRLERVKDVGQVRLVGGRERNIWIYLDRDRLRGYGLAVTDVSQALKSEHVEIPGGRVETGPSEFIVKTKAEFTHPDQFLNLLLAYRGGAPVYLRDVGRVEDGLEEERTIARLNGERALSLLIRRQSGTNAVAVAHGLKKEIEKLKKDLAPLGVSLVIAMDQSTFIEHSVAEVRFHLVFGGLLAVLLVFLFLRNVRSTLICATVLPTSVIGTFILMSAMGFTQNMMTLLALSLAIGLLIDDAIVVQENIMRHIEHGMAPRAAAQFATKEIALAVFATTMSVVAVFVPVAFMGGIVGRFFYQFGLTVTFAVLISMFVSFTLDPMLSSRFQRKPKETYLYRLSEGGFTFIERLYRGTLRWSLKHRWAVVLLAVAAFQGSGYVAKFIKAEFIPMEDQSEFNIKVIAPLGSSLGATDAVMEKVLTRIKHEPWLQYAFATVGANSLQRVNEGDFYIKMKEKSARSMSQMVAMQWVRKHLADIQEAKFSVEPVPRVGSGARYAMITMDVLGSDLKEQERVVSALLEKMRATGHYVDLDSSYERGKPQVGVYVNRLAAADLGVSPLAVASTVQALVGGVDVAKFKDQGERYDVSLRLEQPFRQRPEEIEQLSVKNNRGQLINLQNVASVKKELGPVQIDRYNRARKITVYANLKPGGLILGDAVKEINGFLEQIQVPPGITTRFSGQAENMKESFGYLGFSLMLAVVVVFMVLAAQFESFSQPLVIMLSLPLSLVGAFGALVLAGKTQSIFTMIGVIMLMGLVTKNGILLVDLANTFIRRDKMERTEALLRAGPQRLRAILMTSLAMIFGMLPIALGNGPGSESRSPMATAVIGGLITSTLLTLVIVPVVYTLMDDLLHPANWWIVKRVRGKLKKGQSLPSPIQPTPVDPLVNS